MHGLWRPFIVLVAVFAALSPLSPRAKFYFWAEVIASLVEEGVLFAGMSSTGTAYELVYTICELGAIIAGLWFVADLVGKSLKLKSWLECLSMAVASAAFFVVLGVFAVKEDFGRFPYTLWLTLGEFALLYISGFMLVVTLRRLSGRERATAGILSVAWLGHCLILYSYSVRVLADIPFWMSLASHFSAVLFAVTCLYVGFTIRWMRFDESMEAIARGRW